MNSSRHLRSVVAYSVAALGLLCSSQAGTYVNDFSSSTLDRMTLNGGFRPAPNDTVPYPNIEGGHLVIVYADGSLQGTAVLDDLDPGKTIESFNMTFKLRIGGGTSTPADGTAVFLGNIDSAANFGEEGPADGQNGINGLTVVWDIFDNGGSEAPAIDVKVNGVVVAHKSYDIFGIISDAFTTASISLSKNGHLTVTYKGQPVFTDIELPGYAPAAGDRFAFGARTGGSTANQWIDDLNITTVEATAVGPTIATQPASITVAERATATFTVVANGSAPFTYQWLSNNVVLDGATSSTYTIQNTPLSANSAKYKVTVTNGAGSITSTEATLTVTADTTKPTVASVAGNEGLNAVIVTFSEPIEATSLAALANYGLSGGLTINSIDTIDDHTVRLNTSAQTAGTQYTLTLNGITDTAATPNTITAGTTANFQAFVLSAGFLKWEYWGGITGTTVQNLLDAPKFQSGIPDSVSYITAFNSRTIFPDDSHNDYGARLSGFLLPTVEGDYRFFISSDDSSQFAISSNADPANLQVIATEPNCCNGFAEPSAANTRTSEPVHLAAGGVYYIEALVKEGGGGDYMMVAWRNELDATTTPASSLQPIAGSFLATYADPGAATITFQTQPASVTAAENTRTTFTAAATGSPAPLTFQWQRKAAGAATFSDIGGATSATYQTPVLKQTTDNGAVYRVLARVPGASVPSSEATLTVIIDSTKPQLLSAAPGENQKSVTLTFSEAVDPTTAAAISSYSIAGLNITAATLKGDSSVVLTTALQTAGTTYTVTATGVKDSAGNTMDATANSKQFVALAIQRGVLKYEAYYGPGGTAVSDLLNYPKYPNSPQLTMLLADFNSNPGNMNDNTAGENFGVRMSGFIVPSETGDYRFFLNSDDSSSLWLSTDDSPLNLSATPIATEPGCCNAFSEPAGDHQRTSAPIHMEQDKMYYVVFIFKEGGGGDYGRVAWRNETDTTPAGSLQPIPGKNLAAALPPSQLNGFILSGGTAPGSGTTPGFKARIYQVNQTGANAPVNQVARAEQELAGIIGPNVADLSTSTGGIWSISDVLNWNQEFNTGGNSTEIGDFQSTSDPARPDQPIPGMPGTGAAAHNLDAIAGEIISYVEFPTAGVFYLGVNSDDGFAVTGTDTPPANNGALVVTGPASIAGSYHALLPGSEGTMFPRLSGPISGKLVYATPPDGCAALTNPGEIAGNIAMIDRGVCTFAAKAQAAKDAGAIAVIIVNSRDPDSTDGLYPTVMGGGIDFPAFMISKPDGAKIKTAVGQNITVSITPDSTPLLGQWNAGRGATDSIFPVIVPAAGLYPLRTVWFEGGGGANFEFFSVADTGEKILINDTANPKALKSFSARTSVSTPTISISQNGANIVITFTGNLYAADKVEGPWSQIAGQGSVTVSATEAAKFYKSGQ